MTALYSHTTRASGTILTASIYNADHQNHINNGIPAQLDDYSSTVAEMQTTTDPGEVGTESQATSMAGEFERLRFAILEIKRMLDGTTAQWYSTPFAGADATGRPPLPAWYINGLDFRASPASAPGFVEVATGWCRSADDTMNLKISTPIRRSITGLWTSAASGPGMGVTFASTRQTAHVFVFKTGASTFDIGFDTALTASNLMTRASATSYRRIGSVFAPTALNGTVLKMLVRGGEHTFTGTEVLGNSIWRTEVSGPTTLFAVTISLLPIGYPVRAKIAAIPALAESGAFIRLVDWWVTAFTQLNGVYSAFPSTGGYGAAQWDVWTAPSGGAFQTMHANFAGGALVSSVQYRIMSFYDVRKGATG